MVSTWLSEAPNMATHLTLKYVLLFVFSLLLHESILTVYLSEKQDQFGMAQVQQHYHISVNTYKQVV